ncbi:MAG: chemotaxis protein CheW [Gemmatimonadales bacterium]
MCLAVSGPCSHEDLTIQLLTFELADRSFGLPSRLLVEVARAVSVAPLPGAPRIIEGVINVRGALVPVLDIRARFGLPPGPSPRSTHHNRRSASSRSPHPSEAPRLSSASSPAFPAISPRRSWWCSTSLTASWADWPTGSTAAATSG